MKNKSDPGYKKMFVIYDGVTFERKIIFFMEHPFLI